MNSLMARRRALMASQSASLPTIYLYDNGVISDFAGSLNNDGYSKNPTYNKATQESTYLRFTCTASSSAYAVRGGSAFTFTNVLPQNCVGRTLHARYKHKNTSSSADDHFHIVVAPTVVTANPFDVAYPDAIETVAILAQEEDFVEGELALQITKTGYVSLCAYKGNSGGGIYDTRVTEVWIE